MVTERIIKATYARCRAWLARQRQFGSSTTRTPKRLIIAFALVLVCAVAAVVLFPSKLSPHPSEIVLILNRLRTVSAAKEQYAAAHAGTNSVELTQEDLAPYLEPDFWKKAVAGEYYLIRSLVEPPVAQLTRQVDGFPENMKLRWGPGGDIEILSDKWGILRRFRTKYSGPLH